MLNSLLGRLLQQLTQRKPEARAWHEARTEHLRRQVSALAARDRIRFTFLPSSETDFIRYFPEDLDLDFRDLLAQGFEFVPRSSGLAGVDLAVITAHGSDIATTIWKLREEAGPEMLIAVWLWDNHLLQLNNLRTAIAADFVFPSHNYLSAYLINPASVAATHVPACACQWTREEASRNFAKAVGRVRSDKLLVNYVDYAFSWRSELLQKLKAQLAQADVLLMDPDDRSRYFAKTGSERMEEWLGYKSTLILPVANDLSTRVFDALLAGQVLVVSPRISDFDEVFPPQV